MEGIVDIINRITHTVEKGANPKIGIGITTRNRYWTFRETYDAIQKFAPEGAQIVVVDDASDLPVKEATFRFEENAGIAKAKNKCFELLDHCDYIFLFDDDTYPVVENWHLPYIDSGLNHAMMIFDRHSNGRPTGNKLIGNRGSYLSYENPCGCMLFYRSICLKMVGGMDEAYGIWGMEHPNHSQRIHNSGLTPEPFIDIPNSLELFYSHDYHQTIARSVPAKVRQQHIAKNEKRYKAHKNSIGYQPYKQNLPNAIITTYFTGVADPQRSKKWVPDYEQIKPLINSLQGERLVILHDCFDVPDTENVKHIKVDTILNPYLERWYAISAHLQVNEYKDVFCVDATDVIMLRSPFLEDLSEYIYVGDEPATLNNEWLKKHHRYEENKTFIDSNSNRKLLNAGVIGGRSKHVEKFIQKLIGIFESRLVGQTDMLAFNEVAYLHSPHPIMHGRKVTTVFKSYQANDVSWFKHK